MDFITKIKSLDPDEVLAYRTPRVSRIRDRYLGALKYLGVIWVMVYFVGATYADYEATA